MRRPRLAPGPGKYRAYMVMQSPQVRELDPPAWLAELGGFDAVDLWIPVGPYVVE